MTVDTLPTVDVAGQSPVRGKPDPASRTLLQKIAREPLVHFLVLGGALFVVNAVVFPSVPAERRIDFTAADRQAIVETFVGDRKREPTAEELKYLIDTWLLNEITYREALAQGLDKGDEMIRERLMQKMRVLIFSNLQVDTPSDAELTHWMEGYPGRYAVADRFTFSDLPVTGATAETDAQAAATALNAGTSDDSVRLRLRNYAGRPLQNVVTSFGQGFATSLRAMTPNQWQAISSADGWHVVRLEQFESGHPLALDDVRDQAVADWKEAMTRARAIQTVHDMGKKFVVRGIEKQ